MPAAKVYHVVLIDGVLMKPCSLCKVQTPLDDFYSNKNFPNGKSYDCATCRKEKSKEYYGRDKKKHNANTAAYARTPKGSYVAFTSTSKYRGIANELSFDQFMSLWQKPCYYCGDSIKTVGIDRVNSSVGYVLTNVVPCCYPCNVAKMDSTQEAEIVRCNKVAKLHPRSI